MKHSGEEIKTAGSRTLQQEIINYHEGHEELLIRLIQFSRQLILWLI
jgi:hypothetical protein